MVTAVKPTFLARIGLIICLFVPSAGWASDAVDRFRFGISVGAEQDIRERIEPFRVALEEILDLPVDLYLIETMGGLVDALAKGEIDYARLSPSAYAAVHTLCACVEPLAAARPDSISDRFYSIMVGRRTADQTALADLEGGLLGISGAPSVAGYRVPLANLAADGVDARRHFRALVRIKDPLDGLRAVLDGRIDAALAWSTLAGNARTGYSAGSLNDLYASGAKGLEKLVVVWRSPGIPYSAHTVRLALPDEFKRRLRAGLLDIRDTAPDAYLAVEPDYPGGFEPVVHTDFRAVLRTYDPDLRATLDP